MAIIFHTQVTNPNNVPIYPDSIKGSSWYATLESNLENVKGYISSPVCTNSTPGSYVIFFDDYTALTTFTTAITMSSEIQSAYNTYKTTNNLTITHSVLNGNPTADSVPNPF